MAFKKCPQCGLNNDAFEETCERCGYIFNPRPEEPQVEAPQQSRQIPIPEEYASSPQSEVLPPRKESTRANVVSCSDCGARISPHAVLCPHCGRQYGLLRVDRAGWSTSIAWGVILAGLIVWLISFLLTILFFILFLGGLASLSQPGRSPSSYNR